VLVESHSLVYQIGGVLYNLREHILGLDLRPRDYMASLIQFNCENPEWGLRDRNTGDA